MPTENEHLPSVDSPPTVDDGDPELRELDAIIDKIVRGCDEAVREAERWWSEHKQREQDRKNGLRDGS